MSGTLTRADVADVLAEVMKRIEHLFYQPSTAAVIRAHLERAYSWEDFFEPLNRCEDAPTKDAVTDWIEEDFLRWRDIELAKGPVAH